MKLLVRGLIGLVLLVVVALVATLLLLPPCDGENVRARIQQAVRDNLGRELRYETCELGLLPPSLRVTETTLSGETSDDPPLLEAREIALRVALLPLLFQTVVVDSLVIEGATLRLTRTRDGIELPSLPAADAAGSGEGTESATRDADAEPPSDGGGEDGSVDLAVRELRLRDTTLQLLDRAVSPAVRWELREIDATASGDSLDGPIELEIEATLASGGQVALSGTVTRAGRLDLQARFDQLVIDPLAPYLGDDLEITGRLDGTGAIFGPASSPEKLELDLHGEDVRFRREDLSLRGAVDVRANVLSPAGEANGEFEVDATGAELELAGAFTKPVGTPATLTGRIGPADNGGLAIDDLRLQIKNFEATGRVSSLDPVRAELSAESFDVEGWEALLPGLTGSPPSGRLALDGVVYQADPPDLRGAIQLEELALRSPDAPPLVLRGTLRAEGQQIVSEGLVVETGGETLTVDVRLQSLFDAPRYDVSLKTQGADANALLTAVAGKPDTLHGPLGLDASFRGLLGGDVVSSLEGRIDFGVVNGRLAGVSLLRAVFDRLGAVGSLALDLGKAFGGRDLQRFYGDEFERLTGVFDIANGVARTDDLTFLYRGYGVRLCGTLGLDDLSLDMRGDLTLHEEIDAELAQELGARSSYRPRRREIKLASVKGTLDAPSVSVSSRAAVLLATSYASGSLIDEALGDALGGEAGQVVDSILQGILGGSR